MTPVEHEEWRLKVDAGVRAGIAAALIEHKRAGVPTWIQRNGELVELRPEDIPEDGFLNHSKNGKGIDIPAAEHKPTQQDSKSPQLDY